MPVTYLKPFRDIDEHDVINLFTLAQNSGDAGQFVALQGSGFVATRKFEVAALTAQPGVYSQRYSTPHKVTLAGVNESAGIIGILLKNVRETDYLGRQLLWDTTRAVEANAVISGETVPILTKGLIMVSGYSGTAGIYSGARVGNVAGDWLVTYSGAPTANSAPGYFLGAADGNGYALFKLNCK